jgi:hypothetical protein
VASTNGYENQIWFTDSTEEAFDFVCDIPSAPSPLTVPVTRQRPTDLQLGPLSRAGEGNLAPCLLALATDTRVP